MASKHLRIYLKEGVASSSEVPAWAGSGFNYDEKMRQHYLLLSDDHMVGMVQDYFPQEFVTWLRGRVDRITLRGTLGVVYSDELLGKLRGSSSSRDVSLVVGETAVSVHASSYQLAGPNIFQVLRVVKCIEEHAGDFPQFHEKESQIESLRRKNQAIYVELRNTKDENTSLKCESRDLEKITSYLKLPFWKRWSTKKPEVFFRYGI